MSMSDPIADMLTRIRNACMARHATVLVPSSRMKLAIAQILKSEGFIRDFMVKSGEPFDTIEITLKYTPDRRPVEPLAASSPSTGRRASLRDCVLASGTPDSAGDHATHPLGP